MVEITPRFAQQLELPRGKGDREAPEFHLAMEESKLSGPALDSHLDPTASGKAPFGGLPQSQFFYADANGAGTTGTPARAWYGRCHLNHQTHIRSSITSLKRFSRQNRKLTAVAARFR